MLKVSCSAKRIRWQPKACSEQGKPTDLPKATSPASRAARVPDPDSSYDTATHRVTVRSGREPGNRRRADVVAAGDVGKCVALLTALDRLALVIGEFEWSAHFLASRHGPCSAFAGARPDQIALELRQPAKHGQHQAAVRCRGVGPCVAKGFETGVLGGDRRERVQQVAGGSRQPVEPRHRQHVAGVEHVEQPAKLCAVGLRAARHFAEHLFASGLGELAHLSVNALAVGRYPCVAVFHT
jgi:hypothetical protein